MAVIVVAFALPAVAQETRPPARPPDVQTPGGQADLPKIDLPEFVITGTEVIDPPEVDKRATEESGIYRRHASENLPGPRDRGTVDLGERFRRSLFATGEVHDGLLKAQLGTFFSPLVAAAYGISTATFGMLGRAEYRRTKGFADWTDASRAFLGGEASLILTNPGTIFDDSRLSGGAAYDIRKYKFYGSISPSVQREWLVGSVGIRIASAVGAEHNYHAGLDYRGFSLSDSSSVVTENHVTIAAGSSVPVMEVPLELAASADLSTVTVGSPVSLSLVRLSVSSVPVHWHGLSVSVALNGFAVGGMAGQSGSYVYPSVTARYAASPMHTLHVGYHPGVSFATLRERSEAYPYISAASVIRHTVTRLALSGGVESSWSDQLRTKVQLEMRRMTDAPLYEDGADSGIGSFRYGGTTDVLSARVDLVANITPIDYFSLSATLRSTRNDETGGRVPYLPGFEGSVVYRRTILPSVAAALGLNTFTERLASASGGWTAPGGFWSSLRIEYRGVPRLTVFANFENLLDRDDQVWRRYRVEPLRLDIGCSYRW